MLNKYFALGNRQTIINSVDEIVDELDMDEDVVRDIVWEDDQIVYSLLVFLIYNNI